MDSSTSYPRLRSFWLSLVVAGALLAPVVRAQEAPAVAGPVHAHALPEAPRGPARIGAPVHVTARGTATFEVTYTGFSDEAQAAFQRAVDLWASSVVSAEPIRIEASWTEFDSPNTLGAAGPFVVNFGATAPAAFEDNTWYPIALANAILGRDLDTSAPDIEAEFNAGFARWHFGEGDSEANEIDFTTVVLHELAHGLGFIGAFTVEGGAGTILPTGSTQDPFVFDLGTRDAQGVAALDDQTYPRPSQGLGDLLLSDELFWEGDRLVAEGLTPVRLYAPAVWNPGSSYSHLDQRTYEGRSFMTPFITAGAPAASRRVDATVCALLADLGWELGSACASVIVDAEAPEPAAVEDDLRVYFDGAATRVQAVAARPQSLRLLVYDLAGRRLFESAARAASPQAPAEFVLQRSQFAAGAYVVRVVGTQLSLARVVVLP